MSSPETPMPGKSNLPSEEDLARLADAAIKATIKDDREPTAADAAEPIPADDEKTSGRQKAPAQREGKPVRKAEADEHDGTRRGRGRGRGRTKAGGASVSTDSAAAVPAQPVATLESAASVDPVAPTAEKDGGIEGELLELLNKPDSGLASAAPAATPDAADTRGRSPAAENRRQERQALKAEMKQKADGIQRQIDDCRDLAALVQVARLRSTSGTKRPFLFPGAGKVWNDDQWTAASPHEDELVYNFKEKISEVVQAYIQTQERMGQPIENPFGDQLSYFTKDEVGKILSEFNHVKDSVSYLDSLQLIPEQIGYAQNFTDAQGRVFRVTRTQYLYVNIERQLANGTWETWYGQAKISPSVVQGFRKLEGLQKSGEIYEMSSVQKSVEPAVPATPAAAAEPAAPTVAEPVVEAGVSRGVPATVDTLNTVPEGKVAVLKKGKQERRYVRKNESFVSEDDVDARFPVWIEAEKLARYDPVISGDFEDWTLTIEEPGVAAEPAPAEPKVEGNLDGRDPRNYEEIHIGDVWEVVKGDGVAQRIKITGEMKDGQVSYDFFDGTALHQNELLPLKILVVSLENTQYRLIESGKGGKVGETIEVGIRWPEDDEMMVFVDDKGQEYQVWKNPVRDTYLFVALAVGIPVGDPREITRENLNVHAKGHGWKEKLAEEAPINVPTPEPRPRQEAPGSLAEQLEAARRVVVEKRVEFVRLETGMNQKLGAIRKIFRTIAGSKDLNEEVTNARAEYKAAMAVRLNLEVEYLKQQNLQGEELKKVIRGLVRELDFVEAEELEAARKEAQYSNEKEPLWEKAKKLWADAKTGEVAYFNEYSGVQIQETYSYWKMLTGGLRLAGEAFWRLNDATGRLYNKVNSNKLGKAALIGVSATAGLTLAFSGGGAAAGMAAFCLAAKRGLAGAGLSISGKELADSVARGMRSKASKKRASGLISGAESQQFFQNPDSEGYAFTMTEGLASELLEKLSRENFERDDLSRKRGALMRKFGAVMAGVAVGSYGSSLWNYFSGSDETVQAVKNVGKKAVGTAAGVMAPDADASDAAQDAAEAASAAQSGAAAASAAGAEIARDGAGVGVPPDRSGGVAATAENAAGQAQSAVPEFPKEALAVEDLKMGELLGGREIRQRETIWKYAVAAAEEAGMDERQQQQFAMLVREKINEKLATMSSGDAKAAGFVPNKEGVLTADFIRAGDKLDLSKVLEISDIQEIQERIADGNVGGGARAAAEAVTNAQQAFTPVLADSGRAADIALEAGAQAEVLREVAPAAVDPDTKQAAEALPVSQVEDPIRTFAEQVSNNQNVRDYLSSLPSAERRGLERGSERVLGFLMSPRGTTLYDLNYDARYDFGQHPEFAKTLVKQVVEDSSKLSYDVTKNPLQNGQMQRVVQFAEAMERSLGRVARPGTTESIEEYVLRCAALAKSRGITPRGFNMIK